MQLRLDDRGHLFYRAAEWQTRKNFPEEAEHDQPFRL
jgi:hypothetical protein